MTVHCDGHGARVPSTETVHIFSSAGRPVFQFCGCTFELIDDATLAQYDYKSEQFFLWHWSHHGTAMSLSSNIAPPPLQLASLRYLCAYHTPLSRLPSWVSGVKNLEKLSLRGNHIVELPAAITRLVSLVSLDLCSNKLLWLPSSMGDLAQLTNLYIQNNRVNELPRSFSRLRSLCILEAGGNPLTVPDLDTVRQGPAAVRSYFTCLERQLPFVSRRGMLMIIGTANAGKTSLLRGLQRGSAHLCEEDERTIQLDFTSLWLGRDAQSTLVSCWDLAGQPQYATAQQSYLAAGATYLLAVPAHRCGPAEEREVLGRWLDMLMARAPQATVQLVLTHADKCVANCDQLVATYTEASRQLQLAEDASQDKRCAKRCVQEAGVALAAALTPASLKSATRECIEWLRAYVARHEHRYRTAHHALPTILPDVAVVTSVPRGGTSLLALRSKLEELLSCSSTVPAEQVACRPSLLLSMAHLCALKRGCDRDAYAAWMLEAKTASASDPPPIVTAPRQYISNAELRQLHASCGGGDAELDEALTVLVSQGEIYLSASIDEPSGLIFLSPSFPTELIKPLVDHKLGDPKSSAWDGVASYVKQPLLRKEEMLQRGRLHEDLLRFLWHRLPLCEDDYPSAIAMLCDSGLLIAERCAPHSHPPCPACVSIRVVCSCRSMESEDGGLWLVPMRLPERVPDGLEGIWPPAQSVLKVSYILVGGYVPAGFPERCIASCAQQPGSFSIYHTRKQAWCWRQGAILAEGGVPVALLCIDVPSATVHLEVTSQDGA
eukprot:3342635-Prymnesium_polylepis.1